MRAPSGYLTRNYTTRAYIAEFHPEEHADLVVSQRKLVRNTKTDGMGPFTTIIIGCIKSLWH